MLQAYLSLFARIICEALPHYTSSVDSALGFRPFHTNTFQSKAIIVSPHSVMARMQQLLLKVRVPELPTHGSA